MKNRMWGGRFAEGPDAVMEEINASIDFDRKLFRQDIAGSQGPCPHARAPGHHRGGRCRKDCSGSRHDPARNRSRRVHLLPRARGHPPQHRGAAGRADRPGRRPAAHRPLAQRPGRHRLPAVGARRHRPRRRARSPRCSRRWPTKALEHAATVMPGFTHLQIGAAGDLRPPPDGLCRDARPRPRPLRRRPQAAQRIAARRGGARRHLLSDRPRA